MALERNFSVSLRHFLLIALLILIIHALSSDYGVNGESEVADKRLKTPAQADKGVMGATGSDSVPVKKPQRPKRKSTAATVASLSPLGSNTVKAGNVKPPESPPGNEQEKRLKADSNNKGDDSPLLGSTGQTHAEKDKTNSDAKKNKETDEETAEKDDKDSHKVVDQDDEEVPQKKPSNTGGSSQGVELNEPTYQEEDDEDDEGQELQLSPAGKNFAESEANKLRKTPASEDVSSASNFMTYFVVIAIIVIIAYLIFHNKKKLMAYIVEGRNTSRGRRQRPTAGAEYKPLKSADEASGSRPDDA